jgi:hypothetical protein
VLCCVVLCCVVSLHVGTVSSTAVVDSIRIQELILSCRVVTRRYRVVHWECGLNQNPRINIAVSCCVVTRRYRVVHWECGLNQNPRINIFRVVSLHVGTVSSTECGLNHNPRINIVVSCRVVSLHVGTVSSTESVDSIRIHELISVAPCRYTSVPCRREPNQNPRKYCGMRPVTRQRSRNN